MRVNARVCIEPGCEKPAKGRGLCATHYQRAKYHGLLPKTREKVCRQCGEVFTDRKWNSVYCSQTCRYRGAYAIRTADRQRRTATCDQCGAGMEAKRPDARFCSVACGQAARNARLAEARQSAKGECAHCGAHLPPNARRFCSRSCSMAHRRPEKYGLSPAELRALLDQHSVCAICRTAQWGRKGPAVDHDHATGRVRGILCQKCNVMLGNARDDPAILRAAVAYLEG